MTYTVYIQYIYPYTTGHFTSLTLTDSRFFVETKKVPALCVNNIMCIDCVLHQHSVDGSIIGYTVHPCFIMLYNFNLYKFINTSVNFDCPVFPS